MEELTMKTITIPAKRYEDSDTCLADAARDYAAEHELEAWQVEARWADNANREEIVLEVSP